MESLHCERHDVLGSQSRSLHLDHGIVRVALVCENFIIVDRNLSV